MFKSLAVEITAAYAGFVLAFFFSDATLHGR